MLGPIPGGSERGDVDPGRTDPDRREAHRVQGERGDPQGLLHRQQRQAHAGLCPVCSGQLCLLLSMI